MKDLFAVINERSSIRGYKDEMITKDQMDALIHAGLQAPTARNEQEIHISVVPGGSAVLKELQQDLNPGGAPFYYDAPVVFVLSGKKDFGWSFLDAGIAVENMHLVAKALGLGSVVLGCIRAIMLSEKKAKYNKKLKIPDGYEFEVALAVGYPAVEKIPHDIDLAANVSYVD